MYTRVYFTHQYFSFYYTVGYYTPLYVSNHLSYPVGRLLSSGPRGAGFGIDVIRRREQSRRPSAHNNFLEY